MGAPTPRAVTVVAHFRCTPCRARVWRDGSVAEHVGDLCPGCGGPLEPVERAEELVGLRALRARSSAVMTIADHVRAVIAFNDAARAAGDHRGGGDDLV
jgi:hypothetical protein